MGTRPASDGTLSCRSLLSPFRQHLALPGSVDGSVIRSPPAQAAAPDVPMPLPPALAEISLRLRMSLRGCWAPRGPLRRKRMARSSLVMAWRGIFSLVMVHRCLSGKTLVSGGLDLGPRECEFCLCMWRGSDQGERCFTSHCEDPAH